VNRDRLYGGIDHDPSGAMNQTGNIIRDAWVFDILPENETCSGWTYGRIEQLYDLVYKAWIPYSHLPSNLPPDLLERHKRIYSIAIEKAKNLGWNPDRDIQGEL
tara:strand:+ start:119 stop:430 length:312 start_codon:yes stop_codon:yes gene_type:complete